MFMTGVLCTVCGAQVYLKIGECLYKRFKCLNNGSITIRRTAFPSMLVFFYTPVFRRDVLWYGDVRPGLRPSVRLSVRPSGSPSARFPHFSPTCFDILSWNFAHDFVLLYYRSSSSVVTLRQFLKELCLLVNLEYKKCAVFPHFSLTCFDILSWNFAYDFVLLYYRSSLSVTLLRQFLKELCLF